MGPRSLRLTAVAALVALGACTDIDYDLRPTAANTGTARVETAPRPAPDSRGVISYPSYQVVVARGGDTPSDVAVRIGYPPAELAQFNGLPLDARLNPGEILALPRRIEEVAASPSAAAPGGVDVQTLASSAIDRAEGTPPRDGPEPIRHKVERGETAFSISRLYGVSVEALKEWNGLGRNLTVRTGQYLLIPTVVEAAQPADGVTEPGSGSTTPLPPSASTPLPDEDVPTPAEVAESVPESPNLGALATEPADTATFVAPVTGRVIRDFAKGRNEGIDIAAPAGTPVRAADGGTVAAITRDTDQIPIVVIRHDDGLLTVYANVDNLRVEKGDRVNRGANIAEVRAGDPAFVHFEVRKGLEAVDPNPYIN